MQKLQELNKEQIAVLQKMADEQSGRFSELFKTLLAGVAQQKNVVHGNISNVQSVKIGDEIHYHYHYATASPKTPKYLTTFLPQLPQSEIIGREKELDHLRQMLTEGKSVVVVNGLGGIGKTTLAQVYVHKYLEEYHHVAWITRLSEDIINDFANNADLINNLDIDKTLKEPQDIFNAIIRKLNNIENHPGLLVIDDANESIEKISNYLPSSPAWHTLITSRHQLNGFALKQLDFLSPEEAFSLFKKHYPGNRLTDNDINELIKTVDYHTLTIEILAKTADNQKYEYNRLKEALKSDARSNIQINRPDSMKVERITTFLCTIFSMNQLSDDELWLMKQFACLPSQFLNYDLLKELIQPGAYEKEEIFAETIEELATKGWQLKNKEAESYKMHGIIAEVVKKQHNIVISEISCLIDSLTEKLSLDQNKDNPVDKFQWIPFGNKLLSIIESQNDISPENENKIARHQNNLALRLQDLGDYQGAKILLEKAIKSNEKNFGQEHPTTAVCYSNLATVLQDLGDYQGAKILLEKAMKSAEKNYGQEHPSTARSYSNLALVLKALGDYQGAKILLEKAMKSDEKNFGQEHPSTARSYSNLALVLRDLGDYQGAFEYFSKSLKIYKKQLGEEHPNTAVLYSNLALVLNDLGDYQGALELSGKSVDIFTKVLSEGHPNIKTVKEIYESIKKQIK